MLSRLQLSERMASVGTLAAGVAHEINNPLAYLTGNIGFVLEALGDSADRLASGRGDTAVLGRVLEECRHALSEAQEGAQRVRRIVRDLKDFSRLDEERKTPVELRGAIERALNLAESEIRHRARVETRLADVPAVIADESRLSQVFLNLLVNAAQAIPEGHAETNRIEVEVRPGSRGHVVVEVRDTGCGIAPEHLGRIFDPFFTTKPVGIGTGLGLAICHGIVTGLGGEIEVESRLGTGSTFRVSLPSATVSAAPAEATRPAPPPRRRGRVLDVDDQPLYCRTVERVLASQHEVAALSDPHEALARIEAGEKFDLVLSDLIMPRMTGMDLHDAIARIAPELAERMLFITGGAFTPSALSFVSTRADRVLEKPLGPDALRAAVSAALDRATGAGASKVA
jgi:nitrogen-specific signal transduction histidine kinase/CheY-like chemotaxis protein